MAVAAHVSKVSKDYSPYGYSIMESATATVRTSPAGGGAGDAFSAVLIVPDDADVYIESIDVVPLNTVALHAVDFLIIRCSSFDSGGGDPADHMTTWQTSAAGTVADTIYSQTVLNPTRVTRGRWLGMSVGKTSTAAALGDVEVAIHVRYRRKA